MSLYIPTAPDSTTGRDAPQACGACGTPSNEHVSAHPVNKRPTLNTEHLTLLQDQVRLWHARTLAH